MVCTGLAVFLTSICMEQKYYVYVLICPVTKSIRYVGKGHGYRAWHFSRRNGHCKSWIMSLKKNKLKPIVSILRKDLSEVDSLILERRVIKICKKLKIKLTNLTDGGDGVSGYRHTEETKEKIKDTFFKKGSIPWNKGLKSSKKFRDAVKRGRLHGKTPKVSEKSRLLQIAGLEKGWEKKRKPVQAINKFSNEVCTFSSMTQAAKCGFCQSEISKCCRNEFKKYSHKGYYWRYCDKN